MKDKVFKIAKHPLILGSSIIFIGSMAASAINYLFNLAMGHVLSVSDYGTFSSLIAMFNILSVLSSAIMIVFSKLSATLVGQKKESLLGSLIIAGNLWIGLISLGICLIIVAFSFQIARFLNIGSTSLILITVASLFFSYLSSVPVGVLQGILKFAYFSFVNIGSSIVKLVLGLVFVLFGWKVFGAITGFFISIFSSYIFGFIPLYRYIKDKSNGGFTLSSLHSNAVSYAVPVFLSSIGITSMIFVDTILAKHFFSPTLAGQYGALSLMGRSIFYVISPISAVLFPLIVQKKERKESLTGTLVLALLLVLAPSFVLTLIYFIVPNLVIRIFFPPDYLPVAKYLGLFSIFILLYSVTYILNSFYLSIGKTKIFILTILAALVQVLFIFLWHKNISEFINDLIASAFLLALSLLLYYRKATTHL